ncbi:tetratricopeptide repeat protein [Maricaulis parjimensis]|uniref:tetratricopeptide repeat protein n=1 Tax=Maricaulis parjimensis TaxID=144023 RepID=UPI00193A2691|nr:tetratricopeptide repeat protein [Maricaulis parjimensis]
MKRLSRVLPVLLAMPVLASCISSPPEEEPVSAYGAFLAARYAGVNRDAHGAAEYYIEALDRMPGNAVLTDRAFITSVIAGDLDRAAELSIEASQAGDPSRLATLYHASDLIAHRNYAAALEVLEAGPEYGPYNAFFSNILRQWALVGDGRADEALAGANELRAPGFLSPHLWLHKAMLFDAAGESEAAEAGYRSAVFTSTFRRLATEMYGDFLQREGRRDDAIDLYDNYLRDDPGEASIAQARDAAMNGARAPRLPAIPALAARAVLGPTADLAAQADMDLTIVYMRMVQRMDPQLAPLHVVLAGSLDRIGLHDLALAEYASVSDGPFHLGAQIDRIVLLATLGRMDAAYGASRQLAETTGEPEAMLLYADMARIFSDCGIAVDVYREAIALNRERGRPEDWRYHYFLASCEVVLDDWASAEAAYLEALDIAPNQPVVLNDLGYMWIERGERIEQAFDMVSRAAQMDPDNGNVIDSLGWAYYQLGQYELAVQELERAAELNPGSATANLHLGDAYWQVGRQLEAGFQWRRAADLNPTAQQQADIAYRLEHGQPPLQAPQMAERAENTVGQDGADRP